jgi:hypothetical protein
MAVSLTNDSPGQSPEGNTFRRRTDMGGMSGGDDDDIREFKARRSHVDGIHAGMELLNGESDESLTLRFNRYLQRAPERITVMPPGESPGGCWGVTFKEPRSDEETALILTIGRRLADMGVRHPVLQSLRNAFTDNLDTYYAFEDGVEYRAIRQSDLEPEFGNFRQGRSRALRSSITTPQMKQGLKP